MCGFRASKRCGDTVADLRFCEKGPSERGPFLPFFLPSSPSLSSLFFFLFPFIPVPYLFLFHIYPPFPCPFLLFLLVSICSKSPNLNPNPADPKLPSWICRGGAKAAVTLFVSY